ncbi:MAG TPA: serine hydroxymethyltransferase, partial [Candidatus Omnitrophica bacterium]|nr:serine hydroxymethyltransferase [Candidatus Omnitrophota bacterium]
MNLKRLDSELYNLVRKEISRQREGLTLIASENYASLEVLSVMGSPLSNKYSEGYPQKRYYSGNRFIDQIEKAAIERAKKLFRAQHANVQPHSGSQANEAVYFAILKPGDKVLAFDLSAGGHLSHGAKVNFSGRFYKFFHYGVNKRTERIDFDEVEKKAIRYKPKLIVASTTSYSRKLDFKQFKKIADKIGAYLMADIAHIAGLVVAGLHPCPFPFCDVVTSTTHKTLRGPRGGLILSKKKDRFDGTDLSQKIDRAVFPGIQGGPLEHVIAAKAVCFKEAMKPSFIRYQKQILRNSQAMVEVFGKEGFRIISNGTDNHLFVIDISSTGLSSLFVQKELEKVGIFVNRNKIPFDKKSAFDPSGIRIGTPAITTRGLKEKDCEEVAYLICELIKNIHLENKKSKIKKKVKEISKKFPIYKDIKIRYN